MTERSLYRAVKKQGCSLHKSREGLNINNQGGYMIVNDFFNTIEAGEHFDMFHEDVERWLKG